MSQSTPTTTTTASTPTTKTSTPPPGAGYPPALLHNVSLLALVGCPALILLPPRKLDLYTLLLLSGTLAGANQLSRERTGESLLERTARRVASVSDAVGRGRGGGGGDGGSSSSRNGLPSERAREVQAILRREREARVAALDTAAATTTTTTGGGGRGGEGTEEEEEARGREWRGNKTMGELVGREAWAEEREKLKGEEEAEKAAERGRDKRQRGMLERLWMGGEGSDWKEKRDRREREALEEGKGYGGLIMDQIWEVWTGKSADEEENGDEKGPEKDSGEKKG